MEEMNSKFSKHGHGFTEIYICILTDAIRSSPGTHTCKKERSR